MTSTTLLLLGIGWLLVCIAGAVLYSNRLIAKKELSKD